MALNPYDTNPQGIADPPPPGMLRTTTTAAQPQTTNWSWLADAAPANGGTALTASTPGQSTRPDLLSEAGALLSYDQDENRVVGESPTTEPSLLLAESDSANNLDLLDQVFATLPFLAE